MKRIVSTVIVLILATTTFGQSFNFNATGDSSSKWKYQGIIQSGKGFEPGRFADTATANANVPNIKATKFLIIATITPQQLWYRNYAGTQWLPLNSSTGGSTIAQIDSAINSRSFEVQSNKATNLSSNDNIHYPTTAAANTALNLKRNIADTSYRIGVKTSNQAYLDSIAEAAIIAGKLSANQAISVTATGDATGTSTSSGTAPSLPLNLATVNSNVGSFTNANVTVNAKGLVTAVSNGSGGGGGSTVYAGYGLKKYDSSSISQDTGLTFPLRKAVTIRGIGNSIYAYYCATSGASLCHNQIGAYILNKEDSLNGNVFVNQAIPGDTIAHQMSVFLADTNNSKDDFVLMELALNEIRPWNTFNTIVTRLQAAVDTVRAHDKHAIIGIMQMMPCKQRWNVVFPGYGLILDSLKRRVDSSILGMGVSPILRVNFRISQFYYILGDSTGSIYRQFDAGDFIHQNQWGGQVLGNCIRQNLNWYGALRTQIAKPYTSIQKTFEGSPVFKMDETNERLVISGTLTTTPGITITSSLSNAQSGVFWTNNLGDQAFALFNGSGVTSPYGRNFQLYSTQGIVIESSNGASSLVSVRSNGAERFKVSNNLVNVAAGAALTLTGGTSGTITFGLQGAAGTYNFNMPTTAGSSGQMLISGGGGAGPMTWSSSPTLTALNIATGSNTTIGTATLAGGTVTVSTTAVTASSKIFLTDATTGALTNIGTPTVGTVTAGTSFVINSSNVLDTSNINWFIIN